VGRFDPQKNHRFLLEIAGEILKRRKDVHFLLVGDGPLRPEIEDRARAEGIADKMHFVGSRTDVPRLMRGGMDVFIFPSLWEGLPITLIEAQAAGLQSVVSDTITIEVQVLAELMTPVSLSKHCDEWADKTLDALSGKAARIDLPAEEVARSDFHIKRSVSALSNLYSRLEE
jgi:glycosyltransferase involved in cell wall biosynthesis